MTLAARAHGETLGDGWVYRRPLAFKQVVSDAPGENVAWAEFYGNGTQKADASDIRVTTADRVVVPSRILQASAQNDLVRVAFETHNDGPYYVWWGNEKAQKPEKELEVKRGILLEVARTAGATIDAAPGTALGAFVLPEVNLGFNPAGDEGRVWMHYSAQFKIDRAITAQVAFTVNELGVLAIDGKEVDRELRTGVRNRVQQSVPVVLAVGWHTLDVKQANQSAANTTMAVAWQRPGERVFSVMPGTIFAQAARAAAGPLEKVGAPGYTLDFSVDPTAEGFLPPSYYGQRYTFEAQFPTGMKPTIAWDFGDGQSYTGLRKASHMYLSPGVYTVALRLEGAGEVEKTSVRLPVRERMYERFPRPLEDNVQTLRAILQDYKPEKLVGEQAFRGMTFFESVNDAAGQIAWGRGWLAAKDRVAVGDNVVFDETVALARLLEEQRKYKDAAEVFGLAAAKAIGLEVRTNLMRHQVMTLCDQADDAPGAAQVAQEWINKNAAGPKSQTVAQQAALAYALIATGDGKAAKAAIDAAVAASSPGPLTTETFNRQQIRQGALTRNVENYIREKDFATAASLLNQWELEFPAAIWEGFTRTLRVKLLAAQLQYAAAARSGAALARANPESIYGAELLFRAAENFKAAGQGTQADAAMEMLKSKFPESPYARDAGK